MGLLGSICLLVPIALGSPFITTWNVSYFSQVALPNITAVTAVTINWGDGSAVQTIAAGNTLAATHMYSNAGLFNVSVDGQFYWAGNTAVPKPDMIDIVNWGDGFLIDETSQNLFYYYTNLRVSADPNTHPVFLSGANLQYMFSRTSFDSPLNWDLGNNVTSLFRMFASTPLNKPITFTNTQMVTTLAGLFYNAKNFNQPFSFDCTSVTTLANMFQAAAAFNSPLTLTNTQQVNNTAAMFLEASSFNQPVTFNTSQVKSFYYMFFGASSFNQPLSMDTSQATDMTYMFANAVSFVGSVNFTSVANVTSMDYMFDGATAFSQDLSSWNASAATLCGSFCPSCVLPTFPLCSNACDPGSTFTNNLGQSVCFSQAPTTPTTAAPSTMSPSTVAPTTWAPSTAPSAPSAAPSIPSVAPSIPSVAPSLPSSAPSSPAVSAATGAEPLCLLVVYLVLISI